MAALLVIIVGIGLAGLVGAIIGGAGTAAVGGARHRKKRQVAALTRQSLVPMQIEKPGKPRLVDRLLRRHTPNALPFTLTDAQLDEIEEIARGAAGGESGDVMPLTEQQGRLGINSEAVLLLVGEVRRARSQEAG